MITTPYNKLRSFFAFPLLLSVLLLSSFSCGVGSTLTPTPVPTPANIAGSWTGDGFYGVRQDFSVSMNVNQSGGDIHGSITITCTGPLCGVSHDPSSLSDSFSGSISPDGQITFSLATNPSWVFTGNYANNTINGGWYDSADKKRGTLRTGLTKS